MDDEIYEVYNMREADVDMEEADRLFGHMTLEELEKECERIRRKALGKTLESDD